MHNWIIVVKNSLIIYSSSVSKFNCTISYADVKYQMSQIVIKFENKSYIKLMLYFTDARWPITREIRVEESSNERTGEHTVWKRSSNDRGQ